MDRVRYECRLENAGRCMAFWADDTSDILAIVAAVCSGAQVRDSIRLVVVDTAAGHNRATLKAATCIGFAQAVESMLNAMQQTQTRPVREGEGRDVVVEVKFASHDATLAQCREYAEKAMETALLGPSVVWPGNPSFSVNGQTVGDAWFE